MPQNKDAAQKIVDGSRDQLINLSRRIHAHPELAFEEERSSAWVADVLAEGGFDVEMGICDLPTAFAARAGQGPLHIGICAEYDALPDIGHACGHNVIAAAAVGAGLALAELADELGIRVTVFGTPAEEGGGGKILMLERGAFDGVHAAMMVHPAPVEQESMRCLSVSHIDVHFHGKAAHASAYPEQGINAADAITVAQTAVRLLRQHIRPTDRIHGIVTKGGEAPNIVPAHTASKWYIRAKTVAELEELEPRVHRCFDAGALATGCTVDIQLQSPVYSEMRADVELAALYRANAEQLGRAFTDMPVDIQERHAGSTDMANVSLAIPTIHPMLGLDSLPAVNHQPEFAAYCITPVADQALTDGATAMAWTAIDAATTPQVRNRLLVKPKAGAE
ncbi:MAG TPA: M20 family metallopeptidase [Acidimicrobiales bacterium]|nr:M20 family metallopeptidase [Acidimicrobiales bacterium]